MTFIDIHCHLDYFPDEEIPLLIKNAHKNQVDIILTNGTNQKTNQKSLELGQQFLQVKSCLGLYPIEALKLSDDQISSLLKNIEENSSSMIAVGEVGLDFKESILPDEHKKQTIVFEKIITLAKKINKPLIIHSRKAESACIELLEKKNTEKVLMHCFSGNISLVARIIKNKWHLSIPANIIVSEHFQSVVARVPLTQLFCETDSPFLHPEKKFPNEPANVIESYKKIAEIKKLPLAEVEKEIENNFNTLFKN